MSHRLAVVPPWSGRTDRSGTAINRGVNDGEAR
ncbi:hypothetical protein P3T35_007281 [Kitasatospora sp. GP30]|nr:hypothetical protein [Kitasatospora sp. GP30]